MQTPIYAELAHCGASDAGGIDAGSGGGAGGGGGAGDVSVAVLCRCLLCHQIRALHDQKLVARCMLLGLSSYYHLLA